ncbi:MAG: hypothetical protein MJ207_03595 [Bacilli bacterium]|nr:hypothetical protein [Bacilli bacterium]
MATKKTKETIKKEEHKEEVISLLKRARPTYTFDFAIVALSAAFIVVTTTLSTIYKVYMVLFALILFVILTVDAIFTIKRKKKNNIIVKDCAYFNKEKETLTVYDMHALEYRLSLKDIVKIKQDNLWTNCVYLTYKVIKDDIYNTHKINLGYADKKSFTEFQKKVKALVDIYASVE